MKIKSINIRNFKSIKDITIPLQSYGNGKTASNTTFLVGINESGKSAILEAISLINKGFKDIAYEEYCNSDAQDDKESYIDIYANLELTDLDYWKKQIAEILKLPEHFVNSIIIKDLQKNTYKNIKAANECFNIKINDNLPFFQYLYDENTENIEVLSTSNQIEEEITEKNAKTFLKETQKLLTRETLEYKISTSLKEIFNRNMPKIQIWKPDSKYLINETIDLNKFRANNNISVPLKNIFSIYGKNTSDEINTAIERALNSQAKCAELQEKMSEAVTKYVNRIWKEHKIKVKISINSANCAVHIEDNDKKFRYYSMSQRSDGFKQFISLILSLSAQNESDSLKNNIILIDEPEVHLHPSGIKYMRDEILKIGKNNHIIVSTHSNYMIDTAVRERHWIVQKEKAETKISQMNEDFNFTDDKVLSTAFGLNIFKELLPQNIILVEGIEDKNIFARAFCLLNETFFCSIKEAGGASKISGFARLLSDEDVQPFIIVDADKDGRDCRKDILDKQKEFYSSSNIFTLKDILTSLPNDSTIEDLLPLNFVKNFFNDEMQFSFELDDTKAIIPQLKNQSAKLKEDKQKLNSLKIKLSDDFCKKFKTKKELGKESRIEEFVKLLCEKIETFNSK